ncbi:MULTISPECIES: leucyl/phenylalanyl-tRNA--protein transferase [unclassified Brevibacterium]|jgi:leucyl/phenylalanyl-tRNA--protein transferase|uniref:leucyl/phenylalanyl-tRNA--protein transferase n=1 Tax=unclassified Brevibacterium TaxID=2614124 RepID=UPI001080E4A5|nr:leucyl/phenylalanyl-tRNA--protein transferase [Brevibacterium sp. S111]TGD08777.1 leucyl/phenylalanyl-tRNA--protein transferase [Brevibacterium sp. S111]
MDLEDLRAVSFTATQPQVLLSYRAGLFPMGVGAQGTGRMGWWAPRRRGVLLPGDLRVTKSLRKSMKHFTYSTDRAFEQVMRACADPNRSGTWITEEIISLYCGLHRDGWAHSVEVWAEDELVGGLYGVAIGSFFAGESMFHTARDASKAALVYLVGLFDGVDVTTSNAPAATANIPPEPGEWLIDTQWQTSHLQSLGVSELSGLEYSARLDSALRGDLCQHILNK